jgi:scyllo-inositol 2-dehydrogenase (NADP+)
MIDVGLIGFGLGGKHFHAQVIHAVPGLRLAAILQRTGDEAAQRYPEARIVRNLEELLAIDSIRLIAIASPNQTHFPIAKQCLEAGRDVVLDKPFTNTVADAVELFRIAKRCGRILTVFHSRRFDADFQGLRAYLLKGELGRVVRFETHYDRYRPSGRPWLWRETPGPGSGILFDLGPHLIDHALMLFGPPQSVFADVRIEREGTTTDDAFDLTLEYPGSMRAQLSVSMLSVSPRPRFVVLGTQGSYVKAAFDPLEIALRNFQVPSDDSWMTEKEENWGVATVVGSGQNVQKRVPSSGSWRDFYVNVRDVLLGKAELLVTPQQVMDVMVTLELANHSNVERRLLPWSRVELEPWKPNAQGYNPSFRKGVRTGP